MEREINDKKSPGIAAGAEAVRFRRRKTTQFRAWRGKETSTTMLGLFFHLQVPRR